MSEDQALEARRAAVDEIEGEILGLLRDAVAVHEGDYQARFRRLLWLLALSDEERSFVQAAAEATDAGRPGDAYQAVLVWADWLDDRQDALGFSVRRLAPEAGEVVVFEVDPARYLQDVAYEQAVKMAYHSIDRAMKQLGREVFCTIGAAGVAITRLPLEEMRRLGWERAADRADEASRLGAENERLRRQIDLLRGARTRTPDSPNRWLAPEDWDEFGKWKGAGCG